MFHQKICIDKVKRAILLILFNTLRLKCTNTILLREYGGKLILQGGCVNTFQLIAHYDISRSNIDISKARHHTVTMQYFKYFQIIFKYFWKNNFFHTGKLLVMPMLKKYISWYVWNVSQMYFHVFQAASCPMKNTMKRRRCKFHLFLPFFDMKEQKRRQAYLNLDKYYLEPWNTIQW